MAGTQASERLVWAVDALDVTPSSQVLEIGCGHGVAVSLVAARLESGRIIGLDRSAKMIATARHRNARHVAAGRATFVLGAVESTDLGESIFDVIFAVNVNLLWGGRGGPALQSVQRALKPRGELYLFAQAAPQMRRPSPGHLPDLLAELGYTSVRVVEADLATARVLAVCGARS
ncbi:MAG TPA: class I SAM-dependent methyltransferase [Longimicrobiales bacterium]|nr:class I SAM-dependent methyltransferase [Longimicrobiales bacterium]